MATPFDSFPIRPGPGRSPRRGEVPVRAFLFDTYGTVCDFYRPLSRAFAAFAQARGETCDAGRLANEWRGAYVRSTFLHALTGQDFRPLEDLHRENLAPILVANFARPASGAEIDALVAAWNRLDPWPDAVPGLLELKEIAPVAPLSNGNFRDMIALARHAGLPWDAIAGSSIGRAYKPHPDIYRKSIEAFGLRPEEACMVAAHQADLFYAAGHGMQTAFVTRPDEFGGTVKPSQPKPGVDYLSAAEIHPEGEWTFFATDFLDLAAQAKSAVSSPTFAGASGSE